MLYKVKTYLNIEKSDTSEDLFLNQEIEVAKNRIESWCNQTIFERIQKKYYKVKRGYILIPEMTVSQVIAVKDVVGNPVNFDLDIDGKIYSITSNEFIESRTYEVEFKAGFNPIPASIEQAILEFVTFKYQERKKDRLGKSQESESVSGVSVTNVYMDLEAKLKNDLRCYRA